MDSVTLSIAPLPALAAITLDRREPSNVRLSAYESLRVRSDEIRQDWLLWTHDERQVIKSAMQWDAHNLAALAFADMLESSNSNFNRERFLTACQPKKEN